MQHNYMDELTAAKELITKALGLNQKPKAAIGVVLGSGLSHFANGIKNSPNAAVIPYASIPNFFASTVEGHAGEVIYGSTSSGVPIIVLSGRLHFYEGYSPQSVVLPLRILHLLGIKTIILTNASGAIGDNFEPGELMVVSDHLNLTGQSPLTGPNIDQLGPRFVDMSCAYDRELVHVAKRAAMEAGITMHEGVYVGVYGPAYETPAEIRMYKAMGAHAIGMSTVFETIAARHMNMKVLAISCLANKAAGLSKNVISHEEVMESSAQVAPKVREVLERVIASIGANKESI